MSSNDYVAQSHRILYAIIRSRSKAGSVLEFNAACRAYNPETPEEWVEAAKRVAFTCRRCAGTGAYITGTLNGQPTGPGGRCFRCEGKGVQNDADIMRNRAYDEFAANRAARAMMAEEAA